MDTNFPDIETRQDPAKLWGFVRNDLKTRIENNPQAAQAIIDGTPEWRDEFKTDAFKKYAAKPEFSVIIEPEREEMGERTYYGATAPFKIRQMIKVPAKTRPLADEETENLWGSYKSFVNNPEGGAVITPLSELSPEQAKRLQAVAEAEGSPLVNSFKFDSDYLQAYSDAVSEFEKAARERQGEMNEGFWSTWIGEALRPIGGAFIEAGSGISNLINRAQGGVPFGNPDNMSHTQIQERAMKDAFAELLPYMTGVRDFEDIRKDASTGRKISRGVGDVLSYVVGTPQAALFKTGIRGAAKAGATNTLEGAMAKMAAGGALASAANTLSHIPAPVNEYGAGDFAQDAAVNAAVEGAGAAALGAVFHGLGKAAQQIRGKYNPLYKTVFQGSPENVARETNFLFRKVQSGEANPQEIAWADDMAEVARRVGLDPQKLFSGEAGIEYLRQLPREWVKKTPILKDIMPLERELYIPRETPGAARPDVRGRIGGERFNADTWRAQADESLRRAMPSYGGELDAAAPYGLLPGRIGASRMELARARAAMPNASFSRIPIYLDGPAADAEMSLFGDELPTSNDVLDRRMAPVREVPLDMITLSKDVPNFKEGADIETGVVEGQELQGRYERQGTAPIVLWERENGDLELITGRHRRDLAMRAGEQTIPSQIVREADGFTVDDARTFDAESNIRDGNGSVRDYAHFFKNKADLSEPEAIERGLIARDKGRRGWDIGRNASDDVYDLYRNNKLSEDKAAAIARGAPQNPDVQRAVLKQRNTMNASELGLFARNLDLRYQYEGDAAIGADSQQLDLFASDSPWMQEMEKISRAQAKMIKDNLDRINAVRGAVRRPEAAAKMGVDVRNPDAVRAEIERLVVENMRVENPDPATLQRIRRQAGLDPLGTSNSNVAASNSGAQYLKEPRQTDISPNEIENILRDFGEPVLIDPSVRFANLDGALAAATSNGNIAVNADMNWPIKIGRDEIKKFIYNKPKSAHGILPQLAELIGRAKYDRLMEDRKGRNNLQYHRFFTLANDTRNNVPLVLHVREIGNGDKKYYDINLAEIKAAQTARGESDAKSSSNHEISQSEPIRTPSSNSPESQALSDGGVREPNFDGDPQRFDPAQGPARAPQSKLWERETPSVGHLKPRRITPNTPTRDGAPSTGDIRRFFEKALDLPIRQKTGRKGVLGYYRPKEEVIRTTAGHHNSLRVLTHEIGHDLHAQMFPKARREIGQADEFLEMPEIANELAEFAQRRFGKAYDPSEMVSEGIAEYVHFWLTNPAQAALETPNFHALFEEQLLKYPDLREVLEVGKNLIKRHFEAPAVERVRSQIKSSSDRWSLQTVREKLSDIFHRAYTDWVDELHPLKRATDELREMGYAPYFYDLATNYKGGALGKAEYSVMERSVNLEGKEVGPGLRQILNKVGRKNLAEFRAYLVSRRAVELEKRGIKSGLNPDDAKEVVENLSHDYERHARLLDKYQDQQLRLLVDGGIVSPKDYAKMKAKNEAYIPFYRFREKLMAGGNKGGQGFVNTQDPIRGLKGSDREIVDPLESIVKNTFLFRDLAERNMVAQEFVRTLDWAQGSGRIADPFFKKWTATTLKPEEIKSILRESGIADGLRVKDDKTGEMRQATSREISQYLDQQMRDNPIYNVIFRETDATDAKNGVFKVWDDGKPHYYQLDDRELYRALTLTDSKEMQALEKFPLMKVFTLPSRILRAGAILDPNFATKNPIRDQAEAAIYSNSGYIPFVSAISKGLFEVLGKGRYYQEWKRAGGRFADFTSVDRANAEEVLKRALNDGSFMSRIKNLNPLAALRAFTELTENMTRVAEFKLAMQNERGSLQAANDSKEVTLNFSRHGKYGKIINKIIPFWNAATQDVDKFIRNFGPGSKNVRKRYLKAILGLTLPTIALWYHNKDDEEIQNLPSWRKNLFWNFRVDGDTIWSIPKPFTPGQVFANLPERILDFAYGKDPKAVSDWAAQFVDSINPFSLPPVISVPTDLNKNHSTFTDAPIEGMGLSNLVPSQRANANTSTTAITIADKLSALGIEVSPVKMDYAVQGFTGGLGKLGVAGVDKVLESFNDLDLPPEPDGGWKRAVVVKNFNVNPLSANKYVNQFYEEYEQIKQRQATANKVIDGQLANSIPWIRRNGEQIAEDIGVIDVWNMVGGVLKDLNEAERLIRSDRTMTGKEKYQKLVEINKTKNDVAARFMKVIGGAE